MILVATMDTSMSAESAKSAAKSILKTLSTQSPAQCTITAGRYFYHYIIEHGVVYLTITEPGYPRKLAYSFLEAVQKQFEAAHALSLDQYSRPYACVSFEPKLNRLRRDFADPNSPANIQSLQSDLTSIQHIMQQNIHSILQRGEKLDEMEGKTSELVAQSKKYEQLGRYINIQALYRTYAPMAAIALIVCFVIYLRFFR